MSQTAIVVQGTVKPDGTLELAEKLDIPAGRVQVVIQPLAERHPIWGAKAQARITQLQAAGYQMAVSDANRLECLVGPNISGDPKILANYLTFFNDPGLRVFSLTAAVCERAAHIRAIDKLK